MQLLYSIYTMPPFLWIASVAVSSSDCVWELVGDEKERIRKELVVAQEKYSPRPGVEMLNETT
jgi:hypothetical protein